MPYARAPPTAIAGTWSTRYGSARSRSIAGFRTSTVSLSDSVATSRTSCSFCRQRSPATSSCEKTTSFTGPVSFSNSLRTAARSRSVRIAMAFIIPICPRRGRRAGACTRGGDGPRARRRMLPNSRAAGPGTVVAGLSPHDREPWPPGGLPCGGDGRKVAGMKPFVVNRYGQIVFPSNFFPVLDFSIFETLDQFAAVIKRDFEEKAPTETDMVARADARAYNGRYDLLRDLALNLFWVNRYAMTMYEKRPMRWRDVARGRDDLFLPVFQPWDGEELTNAIDAGYRALPPSWDEGTEDMISRILLDVFRHKKGAGAELPAIKPTVAEILQNPRSLTYHLLAHDPDYPGYGYDDIIEYTHRVPELDALMRQAMVLHNEYRWDRAKTRVIEVGKLYDDDFVVGFY